MTLVNYYQILNIDSHSDLNTIKKAFRKEVALYHPDNNKTPEAVPQFELVVEAFHVLGDTTKRTAYDAMLSKQNTSEVVLVENEEDTYKEWKDESKKTSKTYRNKDLADLLLLDIFLGSDLLDGLLDGTGSIIDSASDALDGIFDLF